MACVAIPFATKQGVPGRLVCCQRVLARYEGVEFRRERADRQALLECANGLRPVIINLIRAGAVSRTQRNWRGAPAEHRGPIRSSADLRNIGWEIDFERARPKYLLKERSVHSQ